MFHQVENSAKIEALIGIAISTLIMTYIVQGLVDPEPVEMPYWAIIVLALLLVTFFALRVWNALRFVIEKDQYRRDKQQEADIFVQQEKLKNEHQLATLDQKCRELELQIEMKKLEG